MSTVRIDLKAPLSWQELTAEQVRAVARITHGGLLREECLIALFCELCGVSLSRKGDRLMLQHGDMATPIDIVVLGDLSSRFSWILDTKPFDIACPFDFDTHLMDTTFGEYFHADALILRYAISQEMEWMRKAFADLDGYERTKARKEEELKAKIIKKAEYDALMNEKRKRYDSLTEVDAMAMELWWSGFKQWLKGQYPLVFEEADDPDDGYSPVETRQNIMLMLNDGKPQDNERIEQSKLHDVLSALQHKIEEAKRIEEKIRIK